MQQSAVPNVSEASQSSSQNATGVQPAPNAPPTSTSDKALTDGLLELLNAPESAQPKAIPSPSNKSKKAALPPRNPAGGPLGESSSDGKALGARRPGSSAGNASGEDLGQPAESPVEWIANKMVQTAEQLRERGSLTAAKQLQQDTLNDLDRLIRELEQSQSSSQSRAPSSSTAQNQQPAGKQPDSSQSDEKPSADQAQRDASRNTPDSSSAENASDKESSQTEGTRFDGQDSPDGARLRTTQPGNRAGLSQSSDGSMPMDVKGLQQSVWGSLPDRRRQQMQSRMVEQFLPTYRKDIEAYYRALAK